MRNIIIKYYSLAGALLVLLGGCATPATPLDTALFEGNSTEVLRLLAAQGNTQAAKDKALLDSLFRAGVLPDSTKYLNVAKNLVANGANINSTSMDLSLLGAKPEQVQFLADHGFNLDARHSNGGQTLTHIAVIMGYEESLRTLVKNRANLNIKDAGNLTPLVWAVYKWGSGSPQEQKAGETAAKTLIQAGARINEKITEHETTVIFEAARFSRPDIVRYLVSAGGDPSITNRLNTSVAEIQEQARAAGQVKEDARQRKLAAARSDPGLLMDVIAITGATAQNYVAIKQGAPQQPSLGAIVSNAGHARAVPPSTSTAATTTTTTTTAQAPALRRAAAADEAWKTCGPIVRCEVADGYNRFCAGPPKPGAPMCKSECRMSSGVAYHDTRLDSTRAYIGSSEACVPGCTGINSCG